MQKFLHGLLLVLVVFVTTSFSDPVIGQSSVITLAFPWGARAAGMGETFTGIADDEAALFYNPAGLGQAPLTKKWLHHTISSPATVDSLPGVKALASQKGQKDIWATTDNNKLFRFSKGSWTDYAMQIVDSGQTVEDLARIFLPEADKEAISKAAYTIRVRNSVYKKEMKKSAKMMVEQGVDRTTADSLALLIATRPTYEHNRTDIYAYLLGVVEDAQAQTLAADMARLYEIAPPLWGQFYTMSIPFEVAFSSTINDIVIDQNSRLWVATDDGLWRYDFEWRRYGVEERIKNDTINALFVNEDNTILIATQTGAYTFEKGLIAPITTDSSLQSAAITSLMQPTLQETYFGTSQGLYLVTSTGSTHIDTTTGLVSNQVNALFYDQNGDLWVGGKGGVSHFDGKSWSRFKFEGSSVTSISEERKNHLWFATDNGAVEYIYSPKKEYTEWKVHHKNNNLRSNDVREIIYHNFDTYVATSEGISVYQHGEIRASIFFENLLPSLHLDNMWHAAVAAIIPIKEYGTIGLAVNQLYFGDIPSYNPDGTVGDTSNAFEMAIGLTYGLPIAKHSSVGITAKYFYSRLEKNVSEVSSIAFDLGVMRHEAFGKKLRFGFSMLNMGPAVAYQEQTDKDPIPFTLRGGVSWRPIDKGATRLTLAMDLDREVIYVDPTTGEPASWFVAIGKDLFNDERETASDELQKIILHIGTEFTFQDLFSGRVGYMHDAAGERKEINLGVGIKAGRILGDFGIIMALGDNTVRQNQVRFSLTYAQ